MVVVDGEDASFDTETAPAVVFVVVVVAVSYSSTSHTRGRYCDCVGCVGCMDDEKRSEAKVPVDSPSNPFHRYRYRGILRRSSGECDLKNYHNHRQGPNDAKTNIVKVVVVQVAVVVGVEVLEMDCSSKLSNFGIP